MFNNLIETNPRTPARARQLVLSIAIHTALIGAAVYGTLQATEPPERPKAEELHYAQTPIEHPAETQPKPPSDVPAVPSLPRGFKVLVPPVHIPDRLPGIDLTRPVTDPGDFTGTGVPGGIGNGIAVGRAQETFQAFEVEKTVAPIPGAGPRYPDMLRTANVEGQVLAQFVVDTAGRVDISTFRVLSSTHDLFTQAVRQHLATARFYPAEIGGRRVKQLVQQPFNFALTR